MSALIEYCCPYGMGSNLSHPALANIAGVFVLHIVQVFVHLLLLYNRCNVQCRCQYVYCKCITGAMCIASVCVMCIAGVLQVRCAG
jgi:hypothetical protein